MFTTTDCDWLIDVAEDLRNDPGPEVATTPRTIFRVPQQLREISPKSYDSKFFSFGLYGDRTGAVSIRDPCRKDFARIFMKITGNKTWSEICDTVVGTSARGWEEHYDDLELVSPTPDDPKRTNLAIVTHLALDAVFIACFIKANHAHVCRKHCFDVKDMDLHEVIKREAFFSRLHLIRLDMVKFENQIPLRLVEKAFNMMPVDESHFNENGDERRGSLTFDDRMAQFVDLTYCNLPGYKPRDDFRTLWKTFNFSEHKHLLHCLYSIVCYKAPAKGGSNSGGGGAAAGDGPSPSAGPPCEDNLGADGATAGDGPPARQETQAGSSGVKGPKQLDRGVVIKEPQVESTTPRIPEQEKDIRGKGKAKVSNSKPSVELTEIRPKGVVIGAAGQSPKSLSEGQAQGGNVGQGARRATPSTSSAARVPPTPTDEDPGSASTTQDGSAPQPTLTAMKSGHSRKGQALAATSNNQQPPSDSTPQKQQPDDNSAQPPLQEPPTSSADNPAGETSQEQRPSADNAAGKKPQDQPPDSNSQKPAGGHSHKGHTHKHSHLHSLHIPTVTQLEEAGIKVSVGRNNSTKRITDVHFKRSMIFGFSGTLYLPAFSVYDETETLFRNLITYEYVVAKGNILVSYVHLMDNLINTEQDVKLLLERGVLTTNSVGSNEVQVQMWNTMLRGVVIHELSPEYREVFDQITLHYKRKVNKLVAEFRKLYLRSPWLFGGAVLLLITAVATVVGTTYTVLTYYYGNKNKQ